MTTRPRVFLSHSSRDKAFARKLDTYLAINGVEVFFDERSIGIGESIPEKIYQGLQSASHLIFVMSVNSLNSTWAREELGVANTRRVSGMGIKILPVKIDDSEVPLPLQHIKYADFSNWND